MKEKVSLKETQKNLITEIKNVEQGFLDTCTRVGLLESEIEDSRKYRESLKNSLIELKTRLNLSIKDTFGNSAVLISEGEVEIDNEDE